VVVAIVLAGTACRDDPSTTDTTPTDEFGGTGSGYVAQCSGWYPDWISSNPPAAEVDAFQLSQGYYLGVPVFETVDGQLEVVAWNPPSPATLAGAPWLAHDFHVPAQRMDYLQALLDYVMLGMPEADFVAQANTKRRWYHVPMMTTSPFSRREPYRGTTKERALQASDHSWIVPGNQLQSYALGYYNLLGSYTLGQVFNDPDPLLSDPSKAQFIDGALVFKLIFVEHDPAKIVAAQDPLVGAPQWQVQDVQAPADPLKAVRLLQLDIAVRDPRATQSGWVFATYVFDKSKAGEPSPWRRLTPVGLQWGNDPDVTGPGAGTLDESWTDTAGLPAVFQGKLGRDGRLNGPVDNPASSCLSCHSTAQVQLGAAPVSAFRGARLVPAGACSDAQDMTWFRNIPGGTPFGAMNNNGGGCSLLAPQPGSPPLHSLDYSLQLADGLESALFYENPNPCEATATAMMRAEEQAAPAEQASPADQAPAMRKAAPQPRRLKMEPARIKELQQQDDAQRRR
jgi:hypothetical protein